MKNLEIVKIFNNIADILELEGVDFKPQAYRRAALTIESLSEDIEEIYKQNKLKELPGIGESIAEKIIEIIQTGKLKYYEQLKKKEKIDVEGLNQIPSLGPKKIKILYDKLNVKNVSDLEKKLLNKKVETLPGFGPETAKKLLEGIKFLKSNPQRFLYAQALPIVEDVLSRMKKYVQKEAVAGSFRRGKETVGDLDFLFTSTQPEKVMQAFVSLPDVQEILVRGKTKSSVRLNNGLQMDARVVQDKEFGSALNYFIGSKEHNVELRKLALSKHYTLSEYGLFRLPGKKWVAGRTEEDIYHKLGMPYIEPELRENMGEISAALKNKLPSLVTAKEINGIFHNHSTWSDGQNSLLEMAQKAEELGLKFISFNDHFGPMGITNPLTEKKLSLYLKEVEKVQKKVGIKIFSGVEIDILKNGSLPLSKSKLKELDVVIASVHLNTKMPEKEMTARICSALENYPIDILGHPTDRLLNERAGLSLNLEKIYEKTQERGVFLEINSLPQRMDLDGIKIKRALSQKCQFALSTDAHTLNQLSWYKYGLLSARRGWLEKKDLLNCWKLSQIEKKLRK